MTDDRALPTVVSFTVNGHAVQAAPDRLLIDACEDAGVYIPRFCHHPRMRPVGMCRMCIVEVDTGRGPALQPSCMITASEGMAVLTESDTTKKAQDGVLEFLLINHPLDCPVCDKGGECPLQDQTLAFGPGETRFVEEKRHFEKPIPISDLVYLDRERCILCDRCTRFAKEVAGDPLIHFVERGNQTQVLTFPDHPFSSYFSGNTVQICPVGALTAAPYRFKARPWDLEHVESTCTTCSVGCRIAVQSSRNQVLRFLGVDIDTVNHGWLCDKGRFGFQSVGSPERLGTPLVRDAAQPDQLVGTTWEVALDAAAAGLREALDKAGPSSVAVLGGARLSNEHAYAWSKFARSVLGTDNVDAQLADGLPPELVLGLPAATIDDACSATTVLLLAPDLKEELPVLYLRLRGAATEGATKLVELGATASSTTAIAAHHVTYRPGEAAATLEHLLAAGGDVVDQLGSGSLVVVLGRPSLASSTTELADATAILLRRFPDARFLTVPRRGNVRGALDMGLAPGLLPGRVTLEAGRDHYEAAWGPLPAEPGLDAAGILEAAASGRIGALVLVGADPLADVPDRDLAERAMTGCRFVVSVDTFPTESTRHADVVLAAGFAEVHGTTTNVEGRVSRLGESVTPPGTARADWMIADELARRLGGDLGFRSVEAIWDEVEALAPSHRGCTAAVMASPAAQDGVLVPVAGEAAVPATDSTDVPALLSYTPPEGITRPPSVDAYSLRLVTRRTLYDHGTQVSMSPDLAGLAAEECLRVHPSHLDDLGVASGERLDVQSARTTVVLAVVADPGVPPGVACLPFRQGGAAPQLIDLTAPVTDIRVQSR